MDLCYIFKYQVTPANLVQCQNTQFSHTTPILNSYTGEKSMKVLNISFCLLYHYMYTSEVLLTTFQPAYLYKLISVSSLAAVVHRPSRASDCIHGLWITQWFFVLVLFAILLVSISCCTLN